MGSRGTSGPSGPRTRAFYKQSHPSSPAGTITTTLAAAATSAAPAVSSQRPYPLLQSTSNSTLVSFPRRPLPATSLSLSAPSQLSSRGLPLAPSANPKYHNAKVVRRFNWQVSCAAVMEEVRRRRRHEDARDKRKRKARSASWRYRRRRFKGPYPFDDDQGAQGAGL